MGTKVRKIKYQLRYLSGVGGEGQQGDEHTRNGLCFYATPMQQRKVRAPLSARDSVELNLGTRENVFQEGKCQETKAGTITN